jgi:hypothetical protein
MKTYVYVDGFNLYYGALKRTRHKWLDVSKLCRLLLPKHLVRAFVQRRDSPESLAPRDDPRALPMSVLIYVGYGIA